MNTFVFIIVLVKLHVQINASTPFAKKFSQLFINYGAGFAFDNFACTFIGIKNSVLNKYLKTIKRCSFHYSHTKTVFFIDEVLICPISHSAAGTLHVIDDICIS